MVVVRRLDPRYDRMGYEIQKGLMIDMPWGDGKAEITESDDGTLTLSEVDGKYQVTLKDVHLSDFVDHKVFINVHTGPEENHLLLENLTIDAPKTIVNSYSGDNTLSGTVLSGETVIEMTGQTLKDSFIKDSHLVSVEALDSSIKRSRVSGGYVENSEVVNSALDNVTVIKDSSIELSQLMSDEVTGAVVGGVASGWDGYSYEMDERRFKDGYFVGNGKRASQHDFEHGYVQVADEEDYVNGLATLTVNRDLPVNGYKYRPSNALKERLEDLWETVPVVYRSEALEMAPFLKDVVESTDVNVEQSVIDEEIARDIERAITEDTSRREVDDFVIDESQFEVNSQQGLQQ